MDDVASRDLICGPLPALKDNRAEAEQLHAFSAEAAANVLPLANYQPGLYVAMDWVASRLKKVGAAAWAVLLDFEQAECLSTLSLCVG
jgi:hypothetical protein